MKPIAWEHAVWRIIQAVRVLGLEGQPECYSVSEAVWLLAGGKASGLRVQRIPDLHNSHWFLRGDAGELIDLTAGQFKKGGLPDYNRAIGAAFYPRPSKLALKLMEAST